MRGGAEFQYLVLRVVPSVERGERINAGVVVYCPKLDFLDARVGLDRTRLRAIAPEGFDTDEVALSLDALGDIARGAPAAGALGRMTPTERFGWLAAPASTAIQPSAVHTGLTHDPRATLDRLFRSLVAAR